MKKRMTNALLAAALALAVLCAGCGGAGDMSGTTTTAPGMQDEWATTYATTTTTAAMRTTTAADALHAPPIDESDVMATEAATYHMPDPGAPYPADEPDAPVAQEPQLSGEKYLEIVENSEVPVSSQSMFTFSMKVDTASYNNVQRYIEGGALPPPDAVKIEEMVNYFNYFGDTQFNGDDPFAVSVEIGPSPFDAAKHMAFVRVKAREMDRSQLPPLNLTYLIDTSGSMYSFDKLPLLKTSFSLLTEFLTENDTVSIVTYAGSSEVLLDGVSGADKDRIRAAIDSLDASGSTAGADGINTAYKLAEKNFRENGNNRIILATDGDFNVGVSSMSGLEALVAEKRDTGIYLSVLGFGMGNLRDDTMETLAKHGNGNASYINSVATAKKVLVDEMGSNLFVIADDVKAQVELNPDNISSYRLFGYENRAMENEDFADDTKDAGEIGVGSDVALMFEFSLVGGAGAGDDGAVEMKYTRRESGQDGDALSLSSQSQSQSSQSQSQSQSSSGLGDAPPAEFSDYPDELFEIRIRYKRPGESESRLMLHPVGVEKLDARGNSDDYRFASAVAGFGHLLRGSMYAGSLTIDAVISQAQNSLGADPQGLRYDFVKLLGEYKSIR